MKSISKEEGRGGRAWIWRLGTADGGVHQSVLGVAGE